MLYFAYGSNMNLEQMIYRCAGATLCGFGALENYKLYERKYADIQCCKGSIVWGALFCISRDNLKSLDRYEGYPNLYTRYSAWINCGNAKIPALVYEMTTEYKRSLEGQKFSKQYLNTCSKGACDCKLPINYYKEKI